MKDAQAPILLSGHHFNHLKGRFLYIEYQFIMNPGFGNDRMNHLHCFLGHDLIVIID